jgi:CubicO group peptidase (beta-lactamase class C family)
MPKDLHDTIQTLLNNLVAEGKERGIQVAVYHEGKLVVDAWAGVTDVRTGHKVDGDSLFPVFSCTKGIFSGVIHILAERGHLDYDESVAKYWPEFAANGKEGITTRHVLSHMAGLPYMPEGVTFEQVCDWNFMTKSLAGMKPAWPAAENQVYHSLNFGWLLGEIAQRVSGRSVQQLLSEEICRPLGITTMHCGISAELEPTTAFLEMIPEPVVENTPPYTAAPCIQPLYQWMNRREARLSPQPGASGIMSARAMARTYAALVPGGVEGVELVSPAHIRKTMERQVPKPGFAPDAGWPRGLGYILGLGELGPNVATFGHDGYGGSHGFAAPDYRLAVGVTRNRFADFKVMTPIAAEIREALGI